MYHASFAPYRPEQMRVLSTSYRKKVPVNPRWRRLLVVLCVVCLCACAQTGPRQREPSAAAPVDFSGNWELNFAQSDNVQAQMNTLVRNLRKRAERQAARRGERGGAGVVLGSSGTDSAPSVIGLARMADMITDSQLFDIEQSRTRINVEREDNFALTCDFLREATRVRDLGVGREACGWDGSQLVFRIALPEGLSIRHRFSLAPSGDQLGVYTTVFSDRVSAPFSVQRVYDRFEPGDRGYRCKMTVSRGRVCTTESQ